jgi:pyridoxine kinase
MAKVLAISSHVARGHVGLDASVPGLQHLGHEVWALPTVLLPSRPGLGRLVKYEVPSADLSAMLAALEADGCWKSLDGVLTGYFPSPQSVLVAARAVARIKAANPQAVILVDPVMGDNGGLYVAQTTAEAVRDALMPLASIATPNLFELSWLTGARIAHPVEVPPAARQLSTPTVIVTSAWQSPQAVGTMLIARDLRLEREMPKRADIPNGAGDLFAGLLLGNLLLGGDYSAALDSSLATLDRVLGESSGHDVLQLSALRAP